jgi:hypothetical protein
MGILGITLLGMGTMLTRGSRTARWCVVSMEGFVLLVATILGPWFTRADLESVGMWATTVLCPAMVLLILVADPRVRRYFNPDGSGA